MIKLVLVCLTAAIALTEVTGNGVPTGWIFVKKFQCDRCGDCGWCLTVFKIIGYKKFFKTFCLCKGQYRGNNCQIGKFETHTYICLCLLNCFC